MKDSDIKILGEAVRLASSIIENPTFNAQFQEKLMKRSGDEDLVMMFTRYYFTHLKMLVD